ncbi:hypothetical protein [Microbacterium ulmi]|uniref:DUF4868 domain-containing protein n=1 Tax=Microbacterium ulmi TaxID=179095 RepID=A0A7Y2M115_9MICO|nr:hypothetical protein [Microbacterium ulmi]NII68342.1 hypothetical protein [Microbacterium ulmi]NNH03123.1 hypothetical protein [Microbacterium ulmi]
MNVQRVLADLDAQLSASLSLVVGRRSAESGIRRLRLGSSAADALRDQATAARARIADGTATEYSALAELERDEYFLLEDAQSLAELAELRAVVDDIGDVAPVSPSELDGSIGFYAVGLGDGEGRIAFVRRTDPRLAAKPGRLLAIGRDRLESISEPLFAFSEEFDLVIARGWAVVFSQTAFERLARETGIVERHVSTWISGIMAHLRMDADSEQRLRETALRDSRTWRRLRDIQRRGHLANVDLGQVEKYAGSVGLEPSDVVRDGALRFDPDQRFGFLHLLSEDLYTGPLTGERFESQRKAAMG